MVLPWSSFLPCQPCSIWAALGLLERAIRAVGIFGFRTLSVKDWRSQRGGWCGDSGERQEGCVGVAEDR